VGSTNYTATFIRVAEDCPVTIAVRPPIGRAAPTAAALQHQLISEHPYAYTSDDVQFEVYASRRAISDQDRPAARAAFFARSQACLRSSPLGKRYGWGIHHDAEGRIALVPMESDRYRDLAADRSLRQLRAMRSRRAPRQGCPE
jgi:hypothetical protein